MASTSGSNKTEETLITAEFGMQSDNENSMKGTGKSNPETPGAHSVFRPVARFGNRLSSPEDLESYASEDISSMDGIQEASTSYPDDSQLLPRQESAEVSINVSPADFKPNGHPLCKSRNVESRFWVVGTQNLFRHTSRCGVSCVKGTFSV